MNTETPRAPRERTFRISRETIRLRHRNTILGFAFAGALFWIVWRFRADTTEPFRAMLLGLVLLFLVLFGVVHFVGYLRYLRRSRTHRVEVEEDCLYFTTEGERTRLDLRDVLLIERQKRLGEIVSLMLRLRNQRHVRLEGYEDQERLMDLVAQRFDAVSASRREQGTAE
ncbi:MAG: hypothetical protein GY716_07190 [bacterium]|nr:hypothetical protein [bacterium]